MVVDHQTVDQQTASSNPIQAKPEPGKRPTTKVDFSHEANHPYRCVGHLLQREPLCPDIWFGTTTKATAKVYRTKPKAVRHLFWYPLLDPQGYTLHLFSQKTSREVDYRISNKAIHNLSSYNLSSREKTLLGLGLKFIPPSKFPNELELLEEYQAFSRNLRLRWFFRDSRGTPPPLRVPNPSWNPPNSYKPLEDIITNGRARLWESVDTCRNIRQNHLPHYLSRALRKLRTNPKIIVKPADKNLGLCILDREWYLNEGHRQLSDTTVYKSVEHVPLEELLDRLHSVVTKYRSIIGNDGAKFILLKPPNGYRVCSLYFLPKIHKPTVVGRLICSYNRFIFEKTSIWLHHMLFPILTEQPQYL